MNTCIVPIAARQLPPHNTDITPSRQRVLAGAAGSPIGGCVCIHYHNNEAREVFKERIKILKSTDDFQRSLNDGNVLFTTCRLYLQGEYRGRHTFTWISMFKECRDTGLSVQTDKVDKSKWGPAARVVVVPLWSQCARSLAQIRWSSVVHNSVMNIYK